MLLFVAAAVCCAVEGSATEPRQSPMMFGLNESGGEFAGIYPGRDGTHYGYPDYEDLSYARRKGFGLIRLPFRWERIQRPVGSPTLITSEINKIKQVLDWATELGLRVVFDMHNFGRYCTYCDGNSSTNNVYTIIGEDECTLQSFCDVWRMLAREFKDYKCIWGYEIMNEPYSMSSDLPWFDIAQGAIDAIREVDTETPIVVDGDQFASARNWVYYSDNLRNLNDPADNLIFSAHVYFDKNTSGEYTEDYDASGANINTGVERVTPFVEWCHRYNKRGYIGEYGIPDDDSRWNDLLETTLKYLQENGIGGTYWSAGHRWGDYKLAVHPTNNYTTDRPQMTVLEKYTDLNTGEGGGSDTSGDVQYTSIIVWSGSSAASIRFTPESGSYLKNYNNLVGNADGQANLSAGDKIRITYTGAAEGDQVWFQNMEWNNISEISNSMPELKAGDGNHEFTVNDDAVKAIKEKGIMLRRPSTASYSFIRVEVIKAVIDDSAVVPDASETIIWSGSATGDSSIDFRYNPNKSKLLDADLQSGKFIKVYMSDVEEGDQIYIKECTNWECLNSHTIMSADTEVFSMELTADIIDKIINCGMIIQRVGNGKVYDFEIRYITVANTSTSHIDEIESDKSDHIRNVPAYNIYGQRVNPETKGLIIINGKKYFNR